MTGADRAQRQSAVNVVVTATDGRTVVKWFLTRARAERFATLARRHPETETAVVDDPTIRWAGRV